MTEPRPFSHIVVVGSSAGGIEALTTLVGTMPPDLPAPVVVVQHLDPSRASHLAEILGRAGSLSVRTVHDQEGLEPGMVYVVPPDRDVELTDHAIRVLPGAGRSRPSIDRLLTSAASQFTENVIAVILTGTGHDGAAGAVDVQQAGGTVIVQDPATAAFPALPRSLSPAAIDFVVPLPKIGPLICDLLKGVELPPEPDEQEALTMLLRDRYSVDFHSYKRSTILRRVRRRMAAMGSTSIGEYLREVEKTPDEQQALIATFLIKVTQFFRDPDLFKELRDQILPDIVNRARERDHTVRLWSAGCATGEEAYSLAILLAEVLGDELEQFQIRIFATDLDDDAITFARQGLYPAARLAGTDSAIVDRYFEPVNGGFQISKRIRGLMVFGHHDLAQRAPFPRVDLVMCRNVLIYFTQDLQRRILQLFAFSLRPFGYLVLGKSETASPFSEGYTSDDQQLKIYRRREDQPIIPTAPIATATPLTPPRIMPARPAGYGRGLHASQPLPAQESGASMRTEAVLFDLPVGVVVVDPRYDIRYINNAGRSYLGIHGIALGEDLIHLVQTVPAADLRGLVDRAFRGETPVSGSLQALSIAADVRRSVDITCSLVPSDTLPHVSICLIDGTSRTEERVSLEADLSSARETLERAEQRRTLLTASNQELLEINQQLTREIAELRSQNEEYLVGNEELQAATEEVETLNEELQATNEELQATVEELNTTNDDLQTRNAEIQDLAVRLEAARSRLYGVLNSLTDAIAVVNVDGRTVLTNAQYDALFGEPLEDVDALDASGQRTSEARRPHSRAARGEAFSTTFAIARADAALGVYTVTGHPMRGGMEDGGVLVIREQAAEPS